MLEQIEAFQRWASAPVLALLQQYWWAVLFVLGAVAAWFFFPNSRDGSGTSIDLFPGDGDGGGDGGGGD
jgi:hypothetical protein